MAIQNRRGVYSDFTPSKMVPGELAVVQSGDPNNTSGKAVYAAFGASGDVKRLATEDDLGSVDTALGNKVDKVTGKGLSTNDYTTEEKNKLSGIEAQANKTVIDSTLTQTGQAADAKAVGDAIDSVTIETDKTLTEEDVPADAKVVGDELADVRSDLEELAPGVWSDEAKAALLACFQNVAWASADGQSYYDDLYEALYGEPIIQPLWSYVPSDGLLSTQQYVSSYTEVENASETIENNKLEIYVQRVSSISSAYCRYMFGNYNGIFGKLVVKAKIGANNYDSNQGGSMRVEVGDTSKAAQFYIIPMQDGTIRVRTSNDTIDTDYATNSYHTFECIADNNAASIIIDGNVIASQCPLSTSYIDGIRFFPMSGIDGQDLSVSVEKIEYYDEKEGE